MATTDDNDQRHTTEKEAQTAQTAIVQSNETPTKQDEDGQQERQQQAVPERSIIPPIEGGPPACHTPMRQQVFADEKDFAQYNEEEEYTPLGLMIDTLLYKGPGFIIFLSPVNIVCYDYDERVYEGHDDLVNDFNEITNRLGILESVDRSHLSEDQDSAYGRILGEGTARALLDRDIPQAKKAFDAADTYINQRNQESARRWYIVASAKLTFYLSALALVALILRGFITKDEWHPILEGAVATFAGAFGAFLSILQRIGTSPLDVSAGKRMYDLEAQSRIGIGVISALIVVLAFHLQLILTLVNQEGMRFPAVVLLGIVAGFSERMVPGIFRLVEGGTESNATTVPPTQQIQRPHQ